MGRITSRKRPLSERHIEAIDYAIRQIRQSPIAPCVENLILFGSCAREEARWNSDVDLCLVLRPEVKKIDGFSRIIHELKGVISDDQPGSVETDLKVVVGDDWKTSSMLFFKNIRRDGISIWQ